MRKLLSIIFLLLPFVMSAQTQPPILQGSKLYKFKNGAAFDSAVFLPRRDTTNADASMIAPGMIQWRPADQSFYGRDSTGWRRLAAGGNVIDQIDTIPLVDSLEEYVGTANILLVTDPIRGGFFVKKANGSPDNILTWFSHDGDYWHRVYNPEDGILIDWGGADPTGTINSAPAFAAVVAKFNNICLRAGGRYLIDDSLTIANKTNFVLDGKGATIKESESFYTTLLIKKCNHFTLKNVNFDGPENYAYFLTDDPASTKQHVYVDSTDFFTGFHLFSQNKRGMITLSNCSNYSVDDLTQDGIFKNGIASNVLGTFGIRIVGYGFNEPINYWTGFANINNFKAKNTGAAILVGDNATYLSITNCSFDSTYNNGIYISSGLWCTVTGNVMRNVGGTGIKARGFGHTITNNVITNADLGIVLTGNTAESFYGQIPTKYNTNGYSETVSNNIIDTVSTRGIDIDFQDGLVTHNSIISNNQIRINTSTSDYLLKINTKGGTTITGNKIQGSLNTIASFFQYTAGDSTVQNIISNNTFRDCVGQAMQFQGLRRSQVTNNVFDSIGTTALVFTNSTDNTIMGNQYVRGAVINATNANSNARNFIALNTGTVTADNQTSILLYNFPNAQQNLTVAPMITGQIGISGVNIFASNGTATSANWVQLAIAARNINTTAPLSGGGNLTADRTISMTQANTSTNGWLSSTDWNTFNGRLPGSVVATVTELAAHSPAATGDSLILVTDSLRGGWFYWSTTSATDNGTKFGNWWRKCDEAQKLNVCWFGAKGDGVTDDSGPIEDAIAAAGTGWKVFFPARSFAAGKYYKTTRSITINKSGLKIIGEGEIRVNSTTIQATSGTFPLFTVAASEVSFWGVCLRGNGSFTILDPSGAGRWAQGATVSGIRVLGDSGANGDIKVNFCAFVYLDSALVFKARNADVTNSLFSQTKHPIVILDATTGEQRGFKIQNNWAHSPGDTIIDRAFVKCVDQNAFQIWIHNNQLDGQPNSMLADITADSAVQITANNVAMGRGGFLKLTGVTGAVVADNYFLGGSYLTRGDGILLTNTKNVKVSGNEIIQAANNGISLVNADNTTVTDNTVKDFSFPGKGNAGLYNGIILDANSTGNSVYLNQLVTQKTITYSTVISAGSVVTNHIGLNDQYLNTDFPSGRGMEFASTIKAPTVGFAAFGSNSEYDISVVGSELLFNHTGSATNLRLQSNGNVRTDFLFDNSLGISRIGAGNGNGYMTLTSNAGGAEGVYLQYSKAGTATNSLTVSSALANPLQRFGITADSLVIGNASVGSTSVATINGGLIWHAGNDGTGSGLDADLLDGQHASAFALADGTTTTYIRNQNGSDQTGNFRITGQGRMANAYLNSSNPLITLHDGVNTDGFIQMASGRVDINNNNSVTSISGSANIALGGTSASSKVTIAGSTAFPITTVTGSTTLNTTHYTVLVNNSGTVTMTLPAASGATGRIYVIKKISAASNDVNIPNVDARTITLTIQDSALTVQSDGTVWRAIGLFVNNIIP